ncbi:Phycobilisome degradation protein nblA [[Leptolyngbya] sp. PCC 7376]|uniref:NblA/ycf18 family protein n=1 Tax=[Leptolyngbya] sp. PCC 7376 TaxID=111781 RepID=UPI00029F24AA|nr:NblA/ycf18 family protein [[Leptolyngbya] sp. PCC 7376]AFY36873.1 Phycobilisome degradation protein nblA [[Leptolyngbya] sp. PCC 7376]
MTDNPSTLRMEQQFRLKMLGDAVKGASHEQLEELFLEASRQLMLKDNWIHQMFRECHFSGFPGLKKST